MDTQIWISGGELVDKLHPRARTPIVDGKIAYGTVKVLTQEFGATSMGATRPRFDPKARLSKLALRLLKVSNAMEKCNEP